MATDHWDAPVEAESAAAAGRRAASGGVVETAVAQERLGRNTFSGELFVFAQRRRASTVSRVKRADRVKILMWDGTRAAFYHKRLAQGGSVGLGATSAKSCSPARSW